jgi:RHS repeat-associated protein
LKGLATREKTRLWLLLLIGVVATLLGQTNAREIFAPSPHASGVFAAQTQASTGENYDGIQYDALEASNSRSHRTEYFHRGAVKKVTEPSGQVTNFNYNATNGRLTTVTDAVGTISHTSYDSNGNLLNTSETRTGVTGAKTTNRTYDRQGRLASRTDENGQTIGYRYYPSGKIRKIIYPGGTESGVGHVENRRRLVGGLDRSERDVGVARTSHAGLVSQYIWWQDGNLKQVIDKLDSTTTPRITSYVWQNDGRLKKVTRPNNTVREIKYDAAGRPDVIEEYGPGMKLIFVHKHGYYPSDEMKWRYELPSKRTSGTSPPAMSAMSYNADNQLVTWGGQSIAHDPDGNMTTGPNPLGMSLASYSYDARNRLTAALGTTYTYDSDGQRVGKTQGTVATTYAVDVGSPLSKVLVRTKNGVSTRYVWGLGLIYEVSSSGATTTYHHDATGSTLALTDSSAKVIERIGYTPWGQINYRVNVAGTAHDTPFLFTGFFGNQTDANGLLYMRNRYYHPLIGRFLNADPAQEGMNWYGYAGGNPIGMVDPMGLGITGALDAVQTTLSFLGMVPVFGALFDVVNAGISLARGNYVDAAINLASAIPGIGDFAAGAKLIGAGAAAYGGYRGYKAISRSSWHSTMNARYTWRTPPGGHWTQGVSHQMRSNMGIVGSGKELHHWLIPQNGWGKSVPNYIKNQPWNIKVTNSRAAHAKIDTAFSVRGVSPYPLAIRPWMAMPNWARGVTLGTGIGLGYGVSELINN